MLLWAGSYVPSLVADDERERTVRELKAMQRPDGGWPAAAMGDWKREDGSPQDRETSDGYGTGFAVFVLRCAGIPAGDPAVRSGLAWLRGHQRESGRWFTRSLNSDGDHFLSHAGTAFAVMALAASEPAPAK
jgi:squalene-hopene/tetraprenyl-beta-curcumene cyclase